MNDDFSRQAFLAEMRMGFAVTSPMSSVDLPDDGLPAPLQQASSEMREAKSPDERKAAAGKFLALSEEWTDGPKP